MRISVSVHVAVPVLRVLFVMLDPECSFRRRVQTEGLGEGRGGLAAEYYVYES